MPRTYIVAKNILNDLLKNKVILITGASSGIGKSLAYDFSKYELESLVLVSRNITRLDELADVIRGKPSHILPLKCDVSKKDEVKYLSEIVLQKFGCVDMLINNAGIGIFSPVNKISVEEIEQVNLTNYFGMIYCTKFFLDPMIKKKSGHIVNIASLAASFGIPGMAAYCGSKFAILGFSESLKYELRNTGIKISVISPIGVKTNFFNNKYFNYTIPMKYNLNPSTVSNAVLKSITSSSFQIFVPSLAGLSIFAKYFLPFLVDIFIVKQFGKKLR